MNNDEKNYSRPGRANDTWLSAGMILTVMTMVTTGYNLQSQITQSATANERRLTTLEVRLQQLSEQLQRQK
jgi:hypothetical protein